MGEGEGGGRGGGENKEGERKEMVGEWEAGDYDDAAQHLTMIDRYDPFHSQSQGISS